MTEKQDFLPRLKGKVGQKILFCYGVCQTGSTLMDFRTLDRVEKRNFHSTIPCVE